MDAVLDSDVSARSSDTLMTLHVRRRVRRITATCLRSISSHPRCIVSSTAITGTVRCAARDAMCECGSIWSSWRQLQWQSGSDQTKRRWRRLEWFVRRRAPVGIAASKTVEMDRPALGKRRVAHLAIDGAAVAGESLRRCWSAPQRPHANPSMPPHLTASRLRSRSGRVIRPTQRTRRSLVSGRLLRSRQARCGRRRSLLGEHCLESGRIA